MTTGGAAGAVLAPPRFIDGINVLEAQRTAQVLAASARKLPWLWPGDALTGQLAIAAGGPSLADTWQHAAGGADLWALNGAYDFFLDRGITPDGCVILDAREENARFVRNAQADTTFYISSQCHPAVFDALLRHDVVLWHSGEARHIEADILARAKGRNTAYVCGGGTVGLKAMMLAHIVGYRDLNLFGYDSCYRADDGHAYAQDQPEQIMRQTYFAGREWRCAPWMVQQAQQFPDHVIALRDAGSSVTVHGDGLIAEIAEQMNAAGEWRERHHDSGWSFDPSDCGSEPSANAECCAGA